MEVKILTNYCDDLWCIECKERVKIREKYGVIYGTDREGTFELIYHIDCLPTEDEDDVYITEDY